MIAIAPGGLSLSDTSAKPFWKGDVSQMRARLRTLVEHPRWERYHPHDHRPECHHARAGDQWHRHGAGRAAVEDAGRDFPDNLRVRDRAAASGPWRAVLARPLERFRLPRRCRRACPCDRKPVGSARPAYPARAAADLGGTVDAPRGLRAVPRNPRHERRARAAVADLLRVLGHGDDALWRDVPEVFRDDWRIRLIHCSRS